MTPETSSSDFTAASGTLSDWGGSIDFTTAYKNLATLKAKAEWTMDRSTSDVHPLKETNVASTGENPKVSNSLNYDYGMVTKDEEMTTDTSGSTTSMKKALRFSQKKGMEYYFPNATISDSSKQYSSFQFCHDAINSVSVNTGGKQKTLNGINFLQASCSSYGFSNSISHETKAAETTSSSHTGLLIYTDSNYLSYETVTGEDDTISLSISNATSDSDAASWWYGENGGDIFTVYGGTKYYLNSDFSGNLSLSTTASTLWKESISNGNAIFTTTSITVGTDTESMELELFYKSGWLAEAPYYTIQCGGYYLAYNTSSGSLVTGTTSLSSLSSTRSAYFVKKTYSLTTAITDPDDSTKKIVDSATYFQTRDATTTYTLNVNGSRTPVLNTNAVATTSTAVNSTLFLYQNGSHSYLFTQGTDNYGDPFVASGNTGNPKAEYYLCYNSGWKTASVNKIAYEYVLTIGEPTLSTSDSSESESYIRTTNTTATEESTIDTIDTYFPLNNNNNDLEDKSHSSESFGVPGERNTGYFTSGSHLNDDPCSDMRFKPFYESGGGSAQNTAYSGNISYASSDTSKSSPTLATCYTVAADRERTSSASPIYTTIGTDGKYSYTDNGTTVTNQFKKYKASKSKFETESLPQKLDLAFTSTANKADHSICGFHFKSNSSSPDFGKDTVTIPNAYVNDDSSNPWKTNYEIPNPCVDFYLKGSGYVNFFSETDYGGNNSFFGVNLIHRVNNQYLGVYKIKTVWAEADDLKKDGDSYIYELCDSSWNTIGYTQPYNSHLNLTTKALERHPISFDSDGKRTISTSSLDDTYRFTVLDSKPASGVYTKRVFDTKWLIDLSAINGTYKNKFFYFEIPLNDGEYAFSSPGGNSGAYIFYLDVGNNSDEIKRSTVVEKYLTTASSYQYPIGVAMISSGSNNTDKDGACIQIPSGTGSSGTVKFSKTSDTSVVVDSTLTSTLNTVYRNPGLSVAYTGGTKLPDLPLTSSTVTQEIQTTFDYYVMGDYWVKTIITKTTDASGNTTQTARLFYRKSWTDTWTEEGLNGEEQTHFYYKEDSPYAYDLTDLQSTDNVSFSYSTTGVLLISYSFEDQETNVTHTKTLEVSLNTSTTAESQFVTLDDYSISVTKDGSNVTVTIIDHSGTALTVIINGTQDGSTATIPIEPPDP